MKIVFVVGGSYKAFYLNYLKKLEKIDLLIFQENILYDFDIFEELHDKPIITQELFSLSKKLNCKIIAIVNTDLLGVKNKEILYCDKENFSLIGLDRYLSLIYNNKKILIGCKDFNKKSSLSIKIKIENVKSNNFCTKKCLICDKHGVTFVNNGKISKKNRKICYFSLNL